MSPCRQPFLAVVGLLAFGVTVLAGVAQAQVISIGDDGAATTMCTRAQNQMKSNGAVSPIPSKARTIPSAYRGAFDAAAARYELSPDLLQALAWQESRFQPNARLP